MVRFTSGIIYQWYRQGPRLKANSQQARLDNRPEDPTPPLNPKPCGYQNRDTIGRTSRGQRSSQAKTRQFQKWTQHKRSRRRDYRAWKSALKGTTLRTHGGSIPVPPSSPSPTRVERLRSTVRRTQSSPFNWRCQYTIQSRYVMTQLSRSFGLCGLLCPRSFGNSGSTRGPSKG